LASVRTVVIAGAGIGGLTLALALARRGFHVAVFETADRLEAVGAGIQLSPNASRILVALGLEEWLRPHVVIPKELMVRNSHADRVLARGPLGAAATERYGAPYWTIHRGDLQLALCDAVAATPDIALHLGAKVEDFATRDGGVTVAIARGEQSREQPGIALIAADGLWSDLRRRLGHRATPHFAGHTAWRALVPADTAPPEFAAPAVNLWLGRDAHLVHYPVKAGRMINVVAIVRDDWREPGWTAPGLRSELLDRFPAGLWHRSARDILGAPEQWQKWALYDCAPFAHWGKGPVTLLGDAAHPMLPYLAQGAAMAIEDAAVLADCLALGPDDAPSALRAYESRRLGRTARTQNAARRNGAVYHLDQYYLGGAGALLRTLALMGMGGSRLISRYDWLYGWKPA
jgi:salicylate hydroxylase